MGDRLWFPEQITSVFLKKVKEEAEKSIGAKITAAVISIPYAFTKVQANAMIDTAEIAGLKVLKIVNESSLAASDYSLKATETKNVMIFNFGAGFLDLGIFRTGPSKCQTLILGGTKEIGGDDINNIMLEHCLRECENLYGYTVRSNVKVISKMEQECERIKRILSANTSGVIEIDNIVPDNDFTYTFTREMFEKICDPIFNAAINCVKNLLEHEHLDKNALSDILLVGGCTRIPKIKKLIEEFFGKPPLATINADEAVANGAAIHAAMLSGDKSILDSTWASNYELTEIFPHDLFLNETLLLQHNIRLPASTATTFTLSKGEKAGVYEITNDGKEFIGYAEAKTDNKIFTMKIEIDDHTIIKACHECDEFQVVWARNLTYNEMKYAMFEEDELTKQESEVLKSKVSRNQYEIFSNELKNRVEELKATKKYDKETEILCELLVLQESEWVGSAENITVTTYEKRKEYIEYIYKLIMGKQYDQLLEIKGVSREFSEKLNSIMNDKLISEKKLKRIKEKCEELQRAINSSIVPNLLKGIKQVHNSINIRSKQLSIEELDNKEDELRSVGMNAIDELKQLLNN